MADELVLRISDLRAALDRVLSAASAQLGDDVTMPGDFYWHLPVDAAFDMVREAAELTVGTLTEDLQELPSKDWEPTALWHDISHLVGLLRAVERLALP